MGAVKRLRTLGASVALLALAACGRTEEVHRYRAPKDPMWRMLGAIVPTKTETWYFKLVGPSTRIPAYREEFVAFLKSLRVGDGVAWTLPAGWSEEKGAGDRKSTLRFGRDEPLLEVTVNAFPGDAGGLKANLNRWRGQLGLQPAADVTGTATFEVSGTTVTLADFEGPKMPGMSPPAMHPPTGPADEARAKSPDLRSMFLYDVPSGWTDNPTPQGDRILEFRSGEVLVTFTAFPSQTGELAGNVNRWRGQVGLSALAPEEAERLCRPQLVLNKEGYYVEVLGSTRGIVCAFVLDRGGSMFLKMDGPADAVDREKPQFHRFLQSFRVARHG
jgi:hypothetical protein